MTNELGQGTAVIPWDAVERAYQTTNVPVTQLARDFAIPSSALLDRIKRYGWKRSNCAAAPPPGQPSRMLASRLAEIARSQLAAIERRMKEPDAGDGDNMRRISDIEKLVRLIERISELESKESVGEPATAILPRVIDDARRLELARRLEGLRRQLEFERNAEETHPGGGN